MVLEKITLRTPTAYRPAHKPAASKATNLHLASTTAPHFCLRKVIKGRSSPHSAAITVLARGSALSSIETCWGRVQDADQTPKEKPQQNQGL